MAGKIQALYPKNKKAMAAALPKVTAGIHNALGIPQQAAQAMATADGTVPGTAATPAGTASSGTTTAGTPGTAPAASGGLLKQIMTLATKYPKMSAVTAAGIIGLTVAAFSSVGIVPMLTLCLSRAAWAGATGAATSVAKQVMAGQQVSGKQVAKDAAIGSAFGAAGAILGQGLQSLGKAFAGMFSHSGGSTAQQLPSIQRNAVGNSAPEPGDNTSSYSNKGNNLGYQHAIAQAAGLTHGEKFFLKQGIPYDAQGHRLNIDDETLDKLAAKFKQGAVMTKSALAAAAERGKIPVRPGSLNDF